MRPQNQAFELVEPGRRHWGEVQVKPLVAVKPSGGFGMPVSAVVIQDEMGGQLVWDQRFSSGQDPSLGRSHSD